MFGVNQNVRKFNTKISIIFKSESRCECDLVAVTEKWLREDVGCNEIQPEKFLIFRNAGHQILTGTLYMNKCIQK